MRSDRGSANTCLNVILQLKCMKSELSSSGCLHNAPVLGGLLWPS